MAKSTPDELFALIEKSRLLTPEQMDQARQATEGNGDDAEAICSVLSALGLITRWQAGQLLAGRWSFFLGKYRLLDLIGRGGMGSVFLGEHVTMNRRVALKVLSKQVGKESGTLDKFLAEARLIAALDHPNIVHAYSVDCEGDRYFIVMEYVDGADLQRIVDKEGPMEFSRAADCIRQAADGLAHAHRSHVVHCDIKPSNLLLTDQGAIKVLDMGVARLVGPDSSASKPDESILGSVDYLAPEQALASPSFDHRADIYSLGCTLYFLLTGRPPFGEGTLAQRLMKHQMQPPREISQLRSGVPDNLVQICNRMMSKEPDDRFQSAEEVSRELAALRGGPAKPKPKPAPPLKKAAAVAKEAEETVDNPLEDIFALAETSTTPAKRVPGVRKSGAPPVKKAAADAASEESKEDTASKEDAAKVPARKRRGGIMATPRGKLLVMGGAAGGLLLALVAGVAAFMMSGGAKDKPTSVAQASSDTAKTGADAEKKPETKPDDAKTSEVDLNDLFGTKKPEVAPAEENKTEDKPAEPEKNTGDVPATTTPTENSGGTDPAQAAGPDLTTPDPGVGELPKVDAPPDAPKEEPPKQDPPPAQPAPQEPPKDPQKTDPPKTDPPKKSGVFEGLVKDVELPKVPREAPGDKAIGDPVSLGTLKVDAGSPPTIELIGGKTALKGASAKALNQFDIDQREGGDKLAWLIHFEAKDAPADNRARTDIAVVSLAGDQLQFQWLGGAGVAKVKAGMLRNCGLKFSASGASAWLPLTRAVHVDPLVLDLDRGSKRVQVTIDSAPDPTLVRLQITGVEGDLPKFAYQPSDTVRLQAKGEKEKPVAGIAFEPEKGLPIDIQLQFDLKATSAALALGAFCTVPSDKSRIPLTLGGINAAGVSLQSNVAMCDKKIGTPGLPDPQKRELESQKKACTECFEKLKVVEELRSKLGKSVKLKYRIYLDYDEDKLVLASTEAAAAAEASPKATTTKAPVTKSPFDEPVDGEGGFGPPSKKPPKASKKDR